MRAGTPLLDPFSSPSPSKRKERKKAGREETLLYHAIGNCNDQYVHESHSVTVTVLYPLTNFVNSRRRKRLQKLQPLPPSPKRKSIDIIELRRFFYNRKRNALCTPFLFFLVLFCGRCSEESSEVLV
ncbi:hypothetical protein CEXT_301881 [Caerostris extrusa]|uniref:Uncharacterized protein n=1 Tax=Caerostris extrusa TaxID=172846 RepID=A0AAV4VW24_CAEEX|nr:hypothetical protein CEXT_301881 [Caerostris extrusa]